MQSLTIPTDDATLEQAFKDLDKVMDAWLEAVRDLPGTAEEPEVAQVESAPSGQNLPSPPSAKELQQPSAKQKSKRPKQELSTANPPKAENLTAPSADETPAGSEVPPPKPTPAQTSWRGTIEALSKACEPGISPPPETQPTTPIAATPVAATPTVSEDEALLASLDPKTAEAIRVMRRLSPGKKSVRELLDEYRAATPATVEPATKKSSWWKRK